MLAVWLFNFIFMFVVEMGGTERRWGREEMRQEALRQMVRGDIQNMDGTL
jgi:hypothetical protein